MRRQHDPARHGFASDNWSGIHPDVLAALTAANGGHERGYGNDVYTARLQELFRGMLGEQVEAFPVFNGTGANVLALRAMLPRWGAVITSTMAHIHGDEGGAPEKTGGLKLLTVATPDGKLTPELVDREAYGWGNVHRAQPLAVAITQSTELGTLYTVEEIRALADHAHERGMRLYMDGARIANAAAALGVPLRAFTVDAGVDVISFGGTKNGAMGAEAVVVLDPDAAPGIAFERKTLMQLASKMRFVSAQLVALLEDDLWLRNARQANAMAARLRAGIERGLREGTVRDVAFTRESPVNGVFAVLPREVSARLKESFPFYDWDAEHGEVRWLCSFDTTEEDIDAFVAEIARLTTGS